MRCPIHPGYMGVHKPANPCKHCDEIYKEYGKCQCEKCGNFADAVLCVYTKPSHPCEYWCMNCVVMLAILSKFKGEGL